MDFTMLAFLGAIGLVPLFGLADAIRRPVWAFRRARRNKTVWVVGQIVVPILGTLHYYAFVRPGVRAVQTFDGR